MTAHHLRQLWQLIEANSSELLHELDDHSLVHWLVQRLRERCRLNREEEAEARRYIYSRLLLIREIS
ncbi:hypothetical protein [Thermocoleostomius sinensis]|jgi:hypothetical protein|uniref:Uncharacterized protein n=1 Tax=Thermocoleostomius sinensis A174 TaxID=2016057 RepID=A0A9E8ZFA5_9CYAN|nr:hypothetical protein [Thermocoleostomius sinensis]WAL62305.1 hypothetical protein OXH18_10035 [Thermocoleostomius sinensis A174]